MRPVRSLAILRVAVLSGFAALVVVAPIIGLACTPTPEQTKAECESLLERSEQLFRRALSQVKASCGADADCAAVRSTCRPTCGSAAISTTDISRYEQITSEAQSMCRRFQETNCVDAMALAVPSCQAYRVGCFGGRCDSRPYPPENAGATPGARTP